ncbi:hypothetical protein CLV92_104121 [Kineococcus xinjiangensis]|uniref:Uncharacterized protein n=1 Tax=Kineococcus xinjiangensis TaxID=512762 RepID=A0A2S6ISS5_9ACTN|nr:hypothetical protein CLV92_104121 [Kineococcus xinjiangensis]
MRAQVGSCAATGGGKSSGRGAAPPGPSLRSRTPPLRGSMIPMAARIETDHDRRPSPEPRTLPGSPARASHHTRESGR